MTWLDSRIEKPDSNSFDCYFVCFLECESLFLGFADWNPNGDYTDGEWNNVRCTNGNKIGGQVLYWMNHPEKPEIV